jgi:hypothetical protein
MCWQTPQAQGRPFLSIGTYPAKSYDSSSAILDASPFFSQVETLPDALQRAVAEMAIGGTDGSANGAGGGELEESPKRTGGQAESADFVGTPDAESAPATRPCLAIAAKDASGADGFLFAVFVVKSIQRAVAIEGADNLAMRTGRLLEQLRKRRPFVQAAAKPSLLAHGPMPPQKS